MKLVNLTALIASLASASYAQGPSSLQNVKIDDVLNSTEKMGASINSLNQAYDILPQQQDPQKPAPAASPAQEPDKKTTESPADQKAQTAQAPDVGQQQDDVSIDDPDCTKTKKDKDRNDPCQAGERGKAHGFILKSVQWEIQQGKAAAAQVQHSSKLITDPAINEWVNRFCRNIYDHTDAPAMKYPPVNCQVIDSDEINAFALPSGNVFIYAGLLEKADDEAQVAGVLGHEMAHVAMRHSAKLASKGEVAMIGLYGTMIVCPVCIYPVYYGSQFFLPAIFFKFSRTMEAEADKFGAQYTRNAGYDPEALMQFFAKIETHKEKKGQQASLVSVIFRTHPMTPDRVKAVQKEIAKWAPPEGGVLRIDTVGDGVAVSAVSNGASQHPEINQSQSDNTALPNSTEMGFMGVKRRLLAIRAEAAEKAALQSHADDDITHPNNPTLKKKKKDPDDDPNVDKPVIKSHPDPDSKP